MKRAQLCFSSRTWLLNIIKQALHFMVSTLDANDYTPLNHILTRRTKGVCFELSNFFIQLPFFGFQAARNRYRRALWFLTCAELYKLLSVVTLAVLYL